jgi:hypothetical protein
MFNRLRMLARNAAPHMEQGESVRATVIGRINSRPSGFDMTALDLATNDVAGDELIGAEFGHRGDPNYAVMATERNLYVLRLRPRSFTKFDALAAKHEIGTVEVLLSSLSGKLLIGSLFMGTGFQRSRARRLIAAVGGSVIDDQEFERRRIAMAEEQAGRAARR